MRAMSEAFKYINRPVPRLNRQLRISVCDRHHHGEQQWESALEKTNERLTSIVSSVDVHK